MYEKKILSLIIIAAMLSSLAVSAKMYEDVPNDAWYKEEVEFVSERCVIPGNVKRERTKKAIAGSLHKEI